MFGLTKIFQVNGLIALVAMSLALALVTHGTAQILLRQFLSLTDVRTSRWLIFAPVAILALFAPSANAESIAGLQAVGYSITEIPPVKSDEIYQQCGVDVVPFINVTFDYEQNLFGDCGWDSFMIHYTGSITIPEHDTIAFWLASDDGGTVKIGSNEFGVWSDQGCSVSYESVVEIEAGEYPIDAWFYENGGSTCFMLAWNIDDAGWTIVPPSAFSTSTQPVDTTVPDTSIPSDTSIPESTTTWASTTTSTTTTTTTSTIAPSTTVPVTNPSTTTTPQTTSIPQPEPTMPEPPTTVPLPQIVEPDPPETLPAPPETLELPPDVVDTMPFPVDTYPIPFDTIPEPPDTMPLPPDTLPDAPETLDTLPIEVIAELPHELVEALLDAGDSDIPLTEEQFTTVVDTISDLAPEEAVALITQILATAVTADQAEALATNPDVLAVITEEQATQIFETIEVAALDETQIAELTAAIQDAPLKVQEAFEKTIDIFGGFDDYVPTGSNIPVGERRTLIAIAAGTTLTAAGSKIRRK